MAKKTFNVDRIMKSGRWTDMKLGEKTTVVFLQLPNGFEMAAFSACQDPADYDHKLGVNNAKFVIRNQLLELEAYRLCATPKH
jgi:hypothetical protein